MNYLPTDDENALFPFYLLLFMFNTHSASFRFKVQAFCLWWSRNCRPACLKISVARFCHFKMLQNLLQISFCLETLREETTKKDWGPEITRPKYCWCRMFGWQKMRGDASRYELFCRFKMCSYEMINDSVRCLL